MYYLGLVYPCKYTNILLINTDKDTSKIPKTLKIRTPLNDKIFMLNACRALQVFSSKETTTHSIMPTIAPLAISILYITNEKS